jgi:hypothetical protein
MSISDDDSDDHYLEARRRYRNKIKIIAAIVAVDTLKENINSFLFVIINNGKLLLCS